MNNQKKWREDENFIKLCDIVVSDKLICLTGSGISKNLKLKKGGTAPDWKDLLLEIKTQMESDTKKLSDKQVLDLEDLLSGDATGEQLIEAASILYDYDKDNFNKVFRESVDLEVDQKSEIHEKLLVLEPRGILTYNYDVAHENAIKKRYNKCWPPILPSNSEKIVKLLKSNFDKPFLFKMHGSVDKIRSMVLTRDSYRNLFNKYPYYKVFMQHIFTNYQLLIIGFGLSDPDFDMLLKNVFSIFGSPVQEHIVIKHLKDKSSNDTLYRLRYGLYFIYVNDFNEIPDIIDDCTKYPGKTLNAILEKCISPQLPIRNEAHNMVRRLNNVGKKCLASILEQRIIEGIEQECQDDYSLNTETSEYVYTYGVIASSTKNNDYKKFLIDNVVEKSLYSEPVAHALYTLRDALEKSDLGVAKRWMKIFKDKNFKKDPHNEDPHNRVYKYAETIYYYLCAKYM